ncbi:MAG TPA: hypothetical protein VI461_13430, partial [Chitinophagaceae bacterium]|nr:hypothetical protein [Chitinophagaceae bacterium]
MKIKIILLTYFLFLTFLIAQENYQITVRTDKEPIASGRFEPTWKSLKQYTAPDWYRNAKF